VTAAQTINYLLAANHSRPMDIVVGVAAVLGMRVHALNTGLTGIATLLRKANGHKKIMTRLNLPEIRGNMSRDDQAKVNEIIAKEKPKIIQEYIDRGLEEDVEVLKKLLRRDPLQDEISCLIFLAALRGLHGDHVDTAIYDDAPTAKAITDMIGSEPFIGFYQKERLWNADANDLFHSLSSLTENLHIARIKLTPPDEANPLEQPDFYLRESAEMTKNVPRVELVPYIRPATMPRSGAKPNLSVVA
jgi:hypothetical protein